MTQDRRKDDKLPEGPLVFTDRNLTAAGLAHLEAERAAACLVHAGGDVWVGVGTKDALRGLLSEDTASQSQAVPSELASLTAEEIDAIWQSMPGGPSHWLKGFGYQNFARAVEAEVILNVQRSLSHSAATGKVAPAVLDLPGAIMNIPCRRKDSEFNKAADRLLYKEGHRDARHDAADLVLERADELAALASPAAPLAGKAEQEDAFNAAWSEIHKAGIEEGWLGIARAAWRAALATKEMESEAVSAEMKRLHDALCFWLPQSHPGLPDAMQERIAADAYLLVGYDDMPDAKSAEELGWIKVAAAVPAEEASAEPSRASRIEWSLRQIIEADDDQSLTQDLIEAGRAALKLAPAEPAPIHASALTDERVFQLWDEAWERKEQDASLRLAFARAIEREVLARLSKPAAQVTGEPASIDTPEFRALATQFYAGKTRNRKIVSYDDLVAHIDRHIAAQAPAGRDAQPFPLIIDIGYRKTLRRQDRKFGPPSWDLYDEDGKLVRVLNSFEENFVDSAIKAMGGKSHAAEQTSGGAK